MYGSGGATTLASTGMAMSIWWPLAGFALVALGLGLFRAGGTFRRTAR